MLGGTYYGRDKVITFEKLHGRKENPLPDREIKLGLDTRR